MKHLQWVEEAIARNPRDAAARVSLVRMLREAGQTERLEQARQDFSALLPMPAELWSEWLEDRLAALRAAATGEDGEELRACAGLFMDVADRSVTFSSFFAAFSCLFV